MELGKALPAEPTRADVVAATAKAIDGVKARGKSEPGQKTMLDVLVPVQAALRRRRPTAPASRRRRARAAERTVPMKAIRGRASFLGERSIGHMDPGARSSVADDRRRPSTRSRRMRQRSTMNVGIVIVSHSPKIAEGAADMVRQMVGDAVPLAWTGGDPVGRARHGRRRDHRGDRSAWSAAGVAILVDLGGAETNSEMAIEMLDEDRRDRVVVCNAPIVEGAVIAATEASGGSSLDAVKRIAEELYS